MSMYWYCCIRWLTHEYGEWSKRHTHVTFKDWNFNYLSCGVQKKQGPICLDPECVIASGDILDAMDQTADPCTDFYRYVCGGWVDQADIPVWSSSVSKSFGELSLSNLKLIKKVKYMFVYILIDLQRVKVLTRQTLSWLLSLHRSNQTFHNSWPRAGGVTYPVCQSNTQRGLTTRIKLSMTTVATSVKPSFTILMTAQVA